MTFLATLAAKLGHQFSARIGSFVRHDRASTAIVFGLAFIPIMLAIGAAVDYARASTMKSRMQAAVDSAALAAASAQAKGGNAATIASAYVAQQFPTGVLTVSTTTTTDTAQGKVTVKAAASVPTAIMKIANVQSINISATATAQMDVSGGGKTEVVLAIDTTGSMAGSKIATEIQAASQFVDSMMYPMGGTTPNPNVNVGIVPFTDYVNVGMQYRNAAWLTVSADYTVAGTNQCYDTYPNAVYSGPYTVPATCYSDGIPYDCSWTNYSSVVYGAPVPYCYTPTYDYTWYGCVGSIASPNDENDVAANAGNQVPAMFNTSCSAPLIRLSNDPTAVKTAISALSAGGETYIAPGLQWAWHLLSPNGPFSDGAAYGSAKKIIVLMTDGANTHSAQYPDHEGSDVTAANTKLTRVCANAKAAGIALYTIAFQVTDTTIQNVLSQCATGVPYYYNAQTTADLTAAYASIAGQVTKLRLVN